MERNLASKLPTMGANTIQEAAIKPAIASLAGTAKLAYMSKRPQPPDKYRSERPSTSRRFYKSQIYSQESGEKKKVKVRTGESEHSDSEQSDDYSGHSVHIQSSKTSSMSLQSSSASSSTINSVKSAAELLEEAKEIAGVLPHGTGQQMVPKKTTSEKKRRTTNETITHLQIPCKVGYLSPSIKIIKKLTMRNMRYNFSPDQKQPLEISCQDNTTKQSVLSLSQNKVLCQKDLVQPQLVVNTTKKKAQLEPQHYQPVLRGSCKIEIPGSLMDPKLSCKVENGFCQGLTSQFLKVTGVNVLDAQGGSFALVSRPQRGLQQAKTNQALSLLAKWTPKTNSEEYKTIHHLCTTHACQVLPLELQLASRVCHTQDMTKTTPVFHQQRPALRHLAAQSDTHRMVYDGIPQEQVGDTRQTGGVTPLPAVPSDALADWQRIGVYYVEKPRIIMCGHAVTLCEDQLQKFWKPAPPKFSCAPATVREILFPKYQVTQPGLSINNNLDSLQTVLERDNVQMNMEQNLFLKNILSRKHKSLMDLRAEDMNLQSSQDICFQEEVEILFDFACVLCQLWVSRPFSAPQLTTNPELSLKLQSDFTTINRELELQEAFGRSGSPEQLIVERSHGILWSHTTRGRMVPRDRSMRSRVGKCASHKGEKGLSCAKLAYILQKLKEHPQTLFRSHSLFELPQKLKGSTLPRSQSLPLLLDFVSFAVKQYGIADNLPSQEWVRDIRNEISPVIEKSRTKNAREVITASIISSDQQDNQNLEDPDMVDLSETLDDGLTPDDLEKMVSQLTQTVNEHKRNNPFDLCRRGALYKKLGQLNKALEDLNDAILLEPHLLDAYWHRHSIYLLRNVTDSALSDLNFIIKHNKNHADAYMSRAEIYRMKNDATQAILNYTQAIRCKPDDAETYFKRANMYEKIGETLLAMEDYAETFAINPARTDALMIHGLHYFHTASLRVALEDFSLLLKQEPRNARARTYRGIIFTKLKYCQKAIEDFSLALHLDPTDWQAFYYRGCLLRKIMPDMALRDLSISVLICDGSKNIGAFFHRGLIYTERRQWQQAVADFKAVIKIDRTVAAAHINLGLIYMQKMKQNYDAIKMFSNALKLDPTYIKGYICRARAYWNVKDLERALKDLTRAIHMRPDAQHLHIMRGHYLCDMEQFDLATFCIQYTAEMNKALGLSLVQQAACQSFLGNNAKATACLVAAANTRPSSQIFIMLGKIQMKEERFTDAVDGFRKGLSYLSPSKTKLSNMPDASELFYLTGLCLMAQGEDSLLPQALDAFSNAVKMNPENADAYYQRGLCRMRLQYSKSVEDFDRALFINPDFFQVYLSLASFYGSKGQYSKAVLNCNEAIRIQPKSVRAFFQRGALKFYLKMYKGALKDLTTAIEIDNTCSFAHYNRGVCYQQLQEYELALQDYSTVLHLPSQKEINFRVLINRALVYVELSDHYSALQDFKAASKKVDAMEPPLDATIYHALGVCYHRLGQLQEAVDAYSEALRLNPFLLDAYIGRGNVFVDYSHVDTNKQAQRDFLTALHLNPLCSSARIGLAYKLQIMGQFQRAWNHFTVAIKVNSKCWSAYEGRAIVNLQMGTTFAAFQDINDALKCSPHSDQLLTNRGVINQFMGDKASAMRDYQNAISLNPRCTVSFFNAANLFFYNRQFEQACEYYSRAIELDRNDESTLLNRAITHAMLRKVPEALQDFSNAVRLNPHSAQAYFNRANLYCSLKKYKLAEMDFTQALQLQPDDALLYKLRADVRGYLGLTEQAVQDYRTALDLQETMQHP